MTTPLSKVIEAAILNLQGRQPKPRSRRQELAPYVPQLRELIATGWSRTEIIGEITALGGKVTPASLRDVLGIPPVKRKSAQARKKSQTPSVVAE